MSLKQEIYDSSLEDSGGLNSGLNQVYCNPSFECDGLDVPVSFKVKDEPSDMLINLNGDSTQDDNGMGESLEDGWKPFLQVDVKEECSMHSTFSWDGDDLAVPESFELKDEISDTLTQLHDIGDITQNNNEMEREKLGDDSKQFLHVDIKEEFLMDDFSVHEQDPLAISPNLVLYSSQHIRHMPFKCSICYVEFSEKCQLTNHCRMHSGDWPNKCATCGRKFITKAYLASHSRKHTGDKPFKCAICRKAFSEKSTLTRHCRIHMGDKPYKCASCAKTFVQRAHLEIHGRLHTGDKPFKCAICNKAFVEKATLTRHCGIHVGDKPFKCASCSKTFVQKAHLKTHSRTHTGDRPFKCATCSKKFSDKSNLTAHCRIHTGEKPYKCALCSKTFLSKAHLTKHHRRQHTRDMLSNGTLAAEHVVAKQI